MKSKAVNSLVVFVIIFLVSLLVQCGSPKQRELKSKIVPSQVEEGISLFNGKSLEGWTVTDFGTQGPVLVSDGKIILNYGDGCSGITWKGDIDFPIVNYEVSLEARRTVGNDFFCGLTFPVKEEFCSLIIGGWGGPVIGISCIDGKDASENETKILKRFDKNVWYKVRLRVTEQKITAWIDGEKLVDFNYPGHKLYVRPEVELSKPFGICTWITTAELKNIRLKKLD